MIELKVHCDCGQKYKFDVEPVNGTMPFTVACTVCKSDGTPKANAMLQQMAIFKPIVTTSIHAPVAMAAPLPIAPPPSGSPPAPPPPIGVSRLRINAAAPEATSTVDTPPPIGALSGTPPPFSARPRPGAAPAPAEVEPGKEPSFALGLLGALVGALVGGIIYFVVFKFTGHIVLLRYVLALGVGALAGWLANLFGRGEGSKELASITAICTLVTIVGAQYFLTMQEWRAEEDESGLSDMIQDGGYGASVKEAKKVVAAIPNGADSEIRMYLAKQDAEEGQRPRIEQISDEQVKDFRNMEWTNYVELASGAQTKEQYWTRIGFDPKEARKRTETGETVASGLAAVLAVFRAGIFSMIAGAGLAFRMAVNARGG